MAVVIMSFASEREAQDAVRQLTQISLGEVRARVLHSSEPLSHDKEDTTSPMITPDFGSIDVRPSESPLVPEAKFEDRDEVTSGSVPATGCEQSGVQLMIEVDDDQEEAVRAILAKKGR